MLFINMYTWEKEKRNEIIQRRLEHGRMTPEGVTVLGEWTAISRNIGFTLFEADDASLLTKANLVWSDLINLETLIVLDTEKDLLKILKKPI